MQSVAVLIMLSVSLGAALNIILAYLGARVPQQDTTKQWPEAIRGGLVLLGLACSITAACIIALTGIMPAGYLKLISSYGMPFSWGLYLATGIVALSPLTTAVALWRVRKTEMNRRWQQSTLRQARRM